jgi:hypothetical protein
VAPIKKIKRPDGATSGVVCFKDPDGAILELVSGLYRSWKRRREETMSI